MDEINELTNNQTNQAPDMETAALERDVRNIGLASLFGGVIAAFSIYDRVNPERVRKRLHRQLQEEFHETSKEALHLKDKTISKEEKAKRERILQRMEQITKRLISDHSLEAFFNPEISQQVTAVSFRNSLMRAISEDEILSRSLSESATDQTLRLNLENRICETQAAIQNPVGFKENLDKQIGTIQTQIAVAKNEPQKQELAQKLNSLVEQKARLSTRLPKYEKLQESYQRNILALGENKLIAVKAQEDAEHFYDHIYAPDLQKRTKENPADQQALRREQFIYLMKRRLQDAYRVNTQIPPLRPSGFAGQAKLKSDISSNEVAFDATQKVSDQSRLTRPNISIIDQTVTDYANFIVTKEEARLQYVDPLTKKPIPKNQLIIVSPQAKKPLQNELLRTRNLFFSRPGINYSRFNQRIVYTYERNFFHNWLTGYQERLKQYFNRQQQAFSRFSESLNLRLANYFNRERAGKMAGGAINGLFDRILPNQFATSKLAVNLSRTGLQKAGQAAATNLVRAAAAEAAGAAGGSTLLIFAIPILVFVGLIILLVIIMPKVNDCCKPYALMNNIQNTNTSSVTSSPVTASPSATIDNSQVLRLLPTTLPTIGSQAKNYPLDACLQNQSVYEEAAAKTGIPWQVIAGIHSVEVNCNPAKSLQNGGPLSGTLLESAIQAGETLKNKYKKIPENFEELVTALAMYNGTGNTNCNHRGLAVPYPAKYCPPSYPYEDHIYPLSFFDNERHEQMYVVYCGNSILCTKVTPYTKPGVITVMRMLMNK